MDTPAPCGKNLDVTRRLASFAADLNWQNLPAEVAEKLKLHILDTIGCGLFGATREWTSIVRTTALRLDCDRRCALWGTEYYASGPTAALVNGTAAHGYELDDMHVRGVMHPGPPAIPAALAAVRYASAPISGRDFLVGIAAGYEVSVRVAACMGVPHLLKGWHPTGTSGVFGAAAAAGRILGLDSQSMVHAFGTAGPHAAGLIAAQYGGMVKRLYVGHAAHSGLFSVFLAQEGFKGIENVLEAPYGGYVRTFDGRGEPSEIVDSLGERYELLNTGFKRYPTAGAIHAGVDALDQILGEHDLSAQDIESLTAYVSHSTKEHCGWPYMANGATGAQMNLSFALASRVLRGKLFVEEYEPQQLTAPDILDFVQRIRVETADDIDAMGEGARYTTRVVIRTRIGSSFSAVVHHPKGTVGNPFTPQDVEGKFRRLAAAVLPATQISRILELIGTLDEVEDMVVLESELALRTH